MNIGYLSVLLLGIAVILFVIGTLGIAKFAARISGGKAAAVALFPPYAFYFSFYELEEEGKEPAIALWMTGIVVTILMLVAFSGPISMVFQGRAAELDAPSIAETAESEFGGKGSEGDVPPPVPELEVDPNQQVAGTNSGTAANGATNGTNDATNNAGTNNAPATTNNAAATNGAAPAQ